MSNSKVPEKCLNNCKTPYGKIIGVSTDNTIAYSNCSSDCVIFDPNHFDGTYTGIKWQCVEYARRWLLKNKNVVYGDVDYASDIWALDVVHQPKTRYMYPLSTHVNGSKSEPKIGDLLIYSKELLGTGHVAIIIGVNLRKGFVLVTEQNFNNLNWEGSFSRKLNLIRRDHKYWILDSYILGWKRVDKE